MVFIKPWSIIKLIIKLKDLRIQKRWNRAPPSKMKPQCILCFFKPTNSVICNNRTQISRTYLTIFCSSVIMPAKADYWKYFSVQGMLAVCQILGSSKPNVSLGALPKAGEKKRISKYLWLWCIPLCDCHFSVTGAVTNHLQKNHKPEWDAYCESLTVRHAPGQMPRRLRLRRRKNWQPHLLRKMKRAGLWWLKGEKLRDKRRWTT